MKHGEHSHFTPDGTRSYHVVYVTPPRADAKRQSYWNWFVFDENRNAVIRRGSAASKEIALEEMFSAVPREQPLRQQ
jgi:hypothetical protein